MIISLFLSRRDKQIDLTVACTCLTEALIGAFDATRGTRERRVKENITRERRETKNTTQLSTTENPAIIRFFFSRVSHALRENFQ